ncbi:MAG: CDGSH iron-sulfur domain-containing protein [Actinomycetota bacterium]|nr:CDGSH iron-sulfur domain-containing protein [Actinomycetota bacterium]
MSIDGANKARELEALLAAAEALNAELIAREEPETAKRLTASVIRPLADAAGARSNGADGAGAGRADGVDRTSDALWQLTEAATRLRAEHGAPAQLLEATAALQALTVGRDPDRTSALRELQAGLHPSIEPAPNGPLLVTNVDDLHDWLGVPLPALPQLALCRCGASELKPFCDGTHATNGFSDAKDPRRIPDQRDTYVGQQVTILDNRGTCQHSGLCTDRVATAFRLDKEPFVAPSGGRMDELIRAVRDCPSGALSYALDGEEARSDVDHNGTRAPAIEVTRDGPYRVNGAIELRDANGVPVAQNEGASAEHYALCRCGRAQNKPFCSGMHWYVGFRDPQPDTDATPTMFEWAGGLPALTRMTRLFYEKRVPEDPLLGPLFANMSADHPERVAKWLGEVFGGPACYSGEYGGYSRMISQHLGKCLTEEWRARWVTLLLTSAREAGLPNDPEFRSAFQAYIEWGSRLAVENSQVDSRPPEHMPMPRWDWSTAAGPPGSRISALPAPSPESRQPVTLPGEGEPVSFEEHIKPLFRRQDRQSMSFAFDLWSYDDVRQHADAVLERLANGSMPCDGAWPQAQIDVFGRWVSSGKPA